MTVYYSERTFIKEITDFLKKDFPRGDINSNYLRISRASTIDYNLLLEYFTCALAKQHSLFSGAFVLPRDLEGKIPGWYVREKGIFVDPVSGPYGKNIYKDDVFVVKFNFFADEKKIHRIPDTKSTTVEDALIGELIEIKHALIDGNYEPFEILREFYQEGEITTSPKLQTSEYLSEILDFPH
jgi:hypothetical protein